MKKQQSDKKIIQHYFYLNEHSHYFIFNIEHWPIFIHNHINTCTISWWWFYIIHVHECSCPKSLFFCPFWHCSILHESQVLKRTFFVLEFGKWFLCFSRLTDSRKCLGWIGPGSDHCSMISRAEIQIAKQIKFLVHNDIMRFKYIIEH